MSQIQPELTALRKIAERLAHAHGERLTTAHLLAALASHPSPAAELLAERRIRADEVLASARAADGTDACLKEVSARAREIGGRMGSRTPAPVHLLIALLGDRRSVAHRALLASGADIGRLRAAAMNLGLGLIGPRRIAAAQAPAAEKPASGASSRAVAVPLLQAPPPTAAKPKPRVRSAQPVSLVPVARGPASRGRGKRSEAPRPGRPKAPPERAPAKAPAPGDRARHAFDLDPKRCPTLSALGRNLTAAAARGELPPVVGRDEEIERILDVLAKREANSPCLVGPVGVGKTSTVLGLARAIAEAEALPQIDARIVVQLSVSELLAGTAVRGSLSARVTAIRKEVAASGGKVVLFLDDVHQLCASDGADELLSELKAALASGELSCIGACSTDDYRKTLEADPALGRRFTPINVEEPSREEAFLILSAAAERLGEHHGIQFDEEALALTVAWSARYVTTGALPDKALSIIDLAGARTRRRGGESVTASAIAEVVAERADMPVERLLETDADRFLRLETILAERVVGHARELERIAVMLRRNAAGLGGRRPLGTFLLLGPTGVGKTETAKAVAEVLFHRETAMTRLDMSEYSEPRAVARLIGAPPGYVGHEAGGYLTEAVRRRPYQVLLLDEIEKAHPDVLTTFLALFDEGRLTDGRGRTVDFTNVVVMMTSNLGAEETRGAARRRVGFGASDRAAAALE